MQPPNIIGNGQELLKIAQETILPPPRKRKNNVMILSFVAEKKLDKIKHSFIKGLKKKKKGIDANSFI